MDQHGELLSLSLVRVSSILSRDSYVKEGRRSTIHRSHNSPESMRIMRQRTCTGVLALAAALALEVVGVQGRFRWRRNSDEAGTGFAVIPAAPGLGCLVGDQFTLTGFPGKTAYDGCYMGSRSEHGFPHYTLNGQQTESSGGLIVSAPDYDNSSQLVREAGWVCAFFWVCARLQECATWCKVRRGEGK